MMKAPQNKAEKTNEEVHSKPWLRVLSEDMNG